MGNETGTEEKEPEKKEENETEDAEQESTNKEEPGKDDKEAEEALGEALDEAKEAIEKGEPEKAADLLEEIKTCLATHSTDLTERLAEKMESRFQTLEKTIKNLAKKTPETSLGKKKPEEKSLKKTPNTNETTKPVKSKQTRTEAQEKNEGGGPDQKTQKKSRRESRRAL